MGIVSNLLKKIQGAESEVDRLAGVVAQWEAEGAVKRAELADLESRIGDEVLADESAADRLTEAATRLRSRIELADRTASAAGRHLQGARAALAVAQAVEKRERAGRLRARAEEHEAKVDALAEQLRALDPTASVNLRRPDPDDRRKARADSVLGIVSIYNAGDRPPFIQWHHDADVLLEEAEALEQSAAGVERATPAARQLIH